MATIPVLNAVGATVNVELPLTPGRAAAALSRPVALSTEDAAFLDGIETNQASQITQETAINTVLGVAADAASTTTTIKAALRGIATALGITALDLGTGTGGSRTLRWFQDTAQWIGGAGATTSATQRVAIASDSPGVIANLNAAALTPATAPTGGLATLGQYNATNPAPTDGQTVALQVGPNGNLLVLPYGNPANWVSGAITTAMTGTTSTSLVAAPGAGLRNYITTIIVSNAHATVGTDIAIQDGSGGATLLTIPAAAVYGGAVITLPTPLRQPTANTALFCANVTTGASTKVSAVGYKGA